MKIYTNKDFTKEIVSKYDKDESPTKFKIGLLTTTERERVNELLTEVTEATAHKVIKAIIELGLRGWTELRNEAGELVEFRTAKKSVLGLTEREVIHPDLYDLPQMFDLWNELADAIRKLNSLSEKTQKN